MIKATGKLTGRVLTAAFICLGGNSVTAAPTEDRRELYEEIADIATDIADLYAQQAEPQQVLLELLESDPKKLISYVSENIAYVPYLGVLQGTEGTLLSGQGNSYDQALTLASLLSRSGYTVQVLVGSLDVPDLPTYAYKGPGNPVVREDPEEVLELIEELKGVVSRANGRTSAPPVESTAELPKGHAGVAEKASQLFEPLIKLDQERALDSSALQEAEQMYALVRFKIKPSDPWKVVDPARQLNVDNVDMSKFIILSDTLPTEHLHRLTMELQIQGKGSTTKVASYSRPISNLQGAPLEFSVTPSGLFFGQTKPDGVFSPSSDIVISSNLFDGSLVTLEGVAMDLSLVAQQGSSSEFLRTLGKKGASVGDFVLSDGKVDSTGQKALMQSLEVVFTNMAPGQKPREFRRVLFNKDLIPESLRKSVEQVYGSEGQEAVGRALAVAALTGSHQLVVSTGVQDPYKVYASTYRALAAGLSELSQRGGNRADLTAVSAGFGDLLARVLNDQAAAFTNQTQGVLQTGASLVMVSSQINRMQGQYDVVESLSTDILLDGRVASGTGTSGPARSMILASIEAAAREHVFVTKKSKAFLVSDRAENGVSSSWQYFAKKLQNGGKPSELDDLIKQAERSLDANSRNKDLMLSHLRGLKKQGVEAYGWIDQRAEASVWLEYEPETGRARLASGVGKGNAITEETVITANMVFTFGKGVQGYVKCVEDYAKSKDADKFTSCSICAMMKLAVGMVSTLTFPASVSLGLVTGDYILETACNIT